MNTRETAQGQDLLTTLFRTVRSTAADITPPIDYSLDALVEAMRTGGNLEFPRRNSEGALPSVFLTVRDAVEAMRNTPAGKERDAKKAQLPAFVANGFALDINGNARQLKSEDFFLGGVPFNGIVQIDLDNHGDPDEVAKAKAEALLNRIKTAGELEGLRRSCLLAARSCSGRGVFLFLLANAEDRKTEKGFKNAFRRACNTVSAYLGLPSIEASASVSGLVIDPATKDPGRKRFITYDPGLFYNPNALELAPADAETDEETDEDESQEAELERVFGETTLGGFVNAIGGKNPAGVESGVLDCLLSLSASSSFISSPIDLTTGHRGHGTRSNSVFIGEQGSGKSSQIRAMREIIEDLTARSFGNEFRMVCAQTTAAMREEIRRAGSDFQRDEKGEIAIVNGRVKLAPRSTREEPRERLLFIRDEAGQTGVAKARNQHSCDMPALERDIFANSTTLPRTKDTQTGVDSVPVHANIAVFSTMEQWAEYRAYENDANGEGRRRLYFEMPKRPKKFVLLPKNLDNIEKNREKVISLLVACVQSVPNGTYFAPEDLSEASHAYQRAEQLLALGWQEAEIETLYFNTACKNACARLALGRETEQQKRVADQMGAHFLADEDYDYAFAVLAASMRVRKSINNAESEAKGELLKSYKDKARDQIDAILNQKHSVAAYSIRKRGENFAKALEDGVSEGVYVLEVNQSKRRSFVRFATAEEKEAHRLKVDASERRNIIARTEQHVAAHSFQAAKASGDVTGMREAVKKYVATTRDDKPSALPSVRHSNLVTVATRLAAAGMWGEETKEVLREEWSEGGLPEKEVESVLTWVSKRPDAQKA